MPNGSPDPRRFPRREAGAEETSCFWPTSWKRWPFTWTLMNPELKEKFQAEGEEMPLLPPKVPQARLFADQRESGKVLEAMRGAWKVHGPCAEGPEC